jgi:p-cumate 2,3-dioxygenase beta subunit
VLSEVKQNLELQMPLPTRADYEDLLFNEAALLDEWRLDEWLALFGEGATYEVPMAGAKDAAASSDELFYIADDYTRLQHRVRRLKKPGAHSEWPRSDSARLISNVRIIDRVEDVTEIASIFVTYRSKNDITDCYFGHHRHHVKQRDNGELIIMAKRTMLDMSSLRPQGRISIIL